MIKATLLFIGSTLLCASVAVGAGPAIGSVRTPSAACRWCGGVVTYLGALAPQSESAGLLLLGSGFVLVSHQLRRKP